jgi:predicted nucleotidyltransferase component of viral defense system
MIINKSYIKEVLKTHPKINSDMIKKDLILSYILQELHLIEQLVFKGGTCLTKCYLNYHRLSEDLDFNVICPKFTSKTKKRKYIRTFLKDIFLPKLDSISNKYGLDFNSYEFDTNETKYCPVKYSENIFRFLIYSSNVDQNPIKIELNVSENNLYNFEKKNIINLNSKHLTYPLINFNIKCHSLQEITLEKMRAILTRKEGIHERDIFDLFLINEIENIFKIDINKFNQKLTNSFLYDSELILQRSNELLSYKLFTEIDNLALKKFNYNNYQIFSKNLFNFIKNILYNKKNKTI